MISLSTLLHILWNKYSSDTHPSRCSVYTALLIPIATCLTSSTLAEDYLGEIVVHGHQPIISEVTSTHELDKVLLEQRGDRGLEQALEVTPNLKLRVGGKGIPRIDVRGLKSRHIKFLVNGIPFHSIQHSMASLTRLSSPQPRLTESKFLLAGYRNPMVKGPWGSLMF